MGVRVVDQKNMCIVQENELNNPTHPLYIYILCINVFVICNDPVEESIHTRTRVDRRGEEVHFEQTWSW